MLGSSNGRRVVVVFGALLSMLSLLVVSSSGRAEPVALDRAPASKEEKKSITVPSGTAMMVKTGTEVSSKDKPGRRFSATLQANLLAGDEVVAKAGTEVYGRVVSSTQVGRGIVASHSNLVLGLTDINIDGTMYPIQTGSFSEDATGIILQRKSVVIPAGSLLEFRLAAPLTVKK